MADRGGNSSDAHPLVLMLFGTETIAYKVTQMVATFGRRKVKLHELIIYNI